MIKSCFKLILLISLAVCLSSCDRIDTSLFGEKEITYKSCLYESFKGSHNYTAEETRKLCEEIANSITPSYEYTDDGLQPSNEFTKCYDKEIKKLGENADEKERELAKLICKYAPEG